MNPSPVLDNDRGNPESIPTSVESERLSLESPLAHYRMCRSFLNSMRRSDQSIGPKEVESVIAHHMTRDYQPSSVAAGLLQQLLHVRTELQLPRLFNSYAPMGEVGGGLVSDRLLPVPVARQYADLLDEWGRNRENEDFVLAAANIRKWLQSIGSHAEYLFYTESEFDDREIRDRFYSEIDPENLCGQDLDLGIARLSSPALHACYTLSGWNTGLGCLQLKDVAVPSFGPQNFPLSDSSSFGLAKVPAHQAEIAVNSEKISLKGFTRCVASKEVWLSLDAQATPSETSFGVRWEGLSPNHPLFMVFYVKAKKCMLEDGSVFLPQKVQRYVGKSQKIIFDQSVELSSSEILNMQVIPLAGSGCFWNTTFLIAFEFTSAQNQDNYSFRFI
jgi:hypothetical protein